MTAEIICVGTELLLGDIVNTNAQFLSRELAELGISVLHQHVIGDNPGRLRDLVKEAKSRSDLLVFSGGLGPTEDDLTKEMVAEYFGLEMELHQPSLDALKAFMERFGKKMTPNNLKQAYFPRGCAVMPNACGTAPGCIVEQGGKTVAVLPGPPMELMDMFDRQLAPYLQARSGQVIRSRFLKIFGLGESNVETLLSDLFHSGNPTLALYCGPGEVTARITARAAAPEKARMLPVPAKSSAPAASSATDCPPSPVARLEASVRSPSPVIVHAPSTTSAQLCAPSAEASPARMVFLPESTMVASHAMCTVRALPSVPAFVESCAFCSVSVRDAASQRQPAPFCEVFASSRSGSVTSAAQTDPAASTMIASTSSQQINFVRLKAHRPFLISAASLPQMRGIYNKNSVPSTQHTVKRQKPRRVFAAHGEK